jgi:pimeloyl-ACP methyl ester carboxylesterase
LPLIAANGAELWYETVGDGPAIVLTPGGLQHGHDVFDGVVGGLSAGHEVVAYDRRFAGRSRSPLIVQTWDQMVDDLIGLMDGLGLERADLGGGATGGAISLRAAARYPDRVRSVFMVNVNGGLICTALLAMPLIMSLEIAERQGMTAVVQSFDAAGRYAPFVPPQAAEDEAYRARLEAMPPEEFAEVLRATIRELFDGSYLGIGLTETIVAKVRAPVLVMHGRGDDVHPRAVALAVHERIPGAEWADVASFRGASDSDLYVKTVQRFLATVSAGMPA